MLDNLCFFSHNQTTLEISCGCVLYLIICLSFSITWFLFYFIEFISIASTSEMPPNSGCSVRNHIRFVTQSTHIYRTITSALEQQRLK